MKKIAKKITKRIMPIHTLRGKILHGVAVKAGLANPPYVNAEYKKWIQWVEPETFLPVLKQEVTVEPLFSIIIPFFNTPNKYLTPLLNSIIGQSFENWELIMGDASTVMERQNEIERRSHQDSRLKYVRIEKNKGISGNTNHALVHAKGKYIVFCDHDDVLNVHALNEIAHRIFADDSIDILYSDEDKLSDNGKWRHSPYFKPDWSPHLFLYTNYTNHLSVVRRELIESVGGLRPDYDGSQDYDLLLRVHASKKHPLNVAHISKILYHWREAAGSTAADYSRKSYAFEAGRSSLASYMQAIGVNAKVEAIKETPGFYREYITPSWCNRVLVVVNVSDDVQENELVIEKLKSLTKSNLEVIFSKTKTKDNDPKTAVVEFTVRAFPEDSLWIDQLVGVLELKTAAAVSPKIVSADGAQIVDIGLVNGPNGEKIPLQYHHGYKDLTVAGGAAWVRDVDELTGNILCYRANQGRIRKYKQTYVVWSHIVFRAIPGLGSETHFNNNLKVLDDGRITFNG